MVKTFLTILWSASVCGQLLGAEADYYRMVTYPVPDDLKLEVSGMALLPEGKLALAIRKGEVWVLENPDLAEADQPVFRRFASGLHEPLGLAWHDGALYTVQRAEMTRLRDTDGDGEADEYLTAATGWGVTGSYHEYAYGPVFDASGNAWMTLNCTIGDGSEPNDNAWRGWSLMVQPNGEWKPVSGGFRSPSGIGTNLAGDVFATDQQGNWFPTCPLVHVRPGAFHGHADALKDGKRPGATFSIDEPLPKNLTVAQAAKQVPHYELPAVWFPYRKMGMSSTDVLCDTTGGKFGPFAGQLFVGEFTMSMITRVFLEKVDGKYQGACFRFREGFQSAALRLAWGGDGSLFVGESNRGWNSLGSRSYGLERLVWTGKTPFEIQAMRAKPDGFELEFTLPVQKRAAGAAANYELSSYTYDYHQRYGSEEVDAKKHTVQSVKVSPDGMKVRMVVHGLREGYVHELNVKGVSAESGEALLHPLACYTLNRIP